MGFLQKLFSKGKEAPTVEIIQPCCVRWSIIFRRSHSVAFVRSVYSIRGGRFLSMIRDLKTIDKDINISGFLLAQTNQFFAT